MSETPGLAAAFGAALQSQLPLLFVVTVLLTWALTLPSLSTPARRLLLVAVVAASTLWAVHLASLFDDAYISLRYARHLTRGNGLVFNVGERVEGYTNFLWTVLLALPLALGLDGPRSAVLGCLLAFAAELLVVARLSARLHPAGRPAVPVAMLLLGGSYTFATYGTSGMETMLSALLLTLAVERALAGADAAAGLCGTLAILTHPDFALLFAALGVAVLLERPTRPTALRFAAPFALLYVPYFLWRWRYYGDLFPNTYYAKSANLTYFSQGTTYVLVSGLAAGVWAMLPLAAAAVRFRPRALFTRFALLGVPLYLSYVAKIGGDFMLGRLLVGVLPILALLAEVGARELVTRWPGLRVPAAALLAGAVLPLPLLPPHEVRWNIADERTYYAVRSWWPTFEADVLDRTPATEKILATGVRPTLADATIGATGWRCDVPLIDILGLTDAVVAHQPLLQRGRPGHEKLATPAYLRSRGVQLSRDALYPPPYGRLTRVVVDGIPLYLGHYEPALVAALRTIPEARVPDLPALLDDHVAKAATRPPEVVAADIAFFRDFYLSVNDDPVRAEALDALQFSLPTDATPR
jgi:hypothetical protein